MMVNLKLSSESDRLSQHTFFSIFFSRHIFLIFLIIRASLYIFVENKSGTGFLSLRLLKPHEKILDSFHTISQYQYLNLNISGISVLV